MKQFDAARIVPLSLSCWGQFDVGRVPVTMQFEDRGLVGSGLQAVYLTEFWLYGRRFESRISADAAMNVVLEGRDGLSLPERRWAAAKAALTSAGIDVETIDYDSIREAA